ncbi:DegT/DnrJ/EryC1/StrS family aminotransferase [Myxococcota bacterium]|nr:DegT/DnrJ/EryC1/StrS family aminotransferase [Myxococcota bacterium]
MFVSSRPALSPRLLFQEPSTCELPHPFTAPRRVDACDARALLHPVIARLVRASRRAVLAPDGLDAALAAVIRGAGADLRLYRVDRHLSADVDALARLATDDVAAVIVRHALGWPEGQVEAIAALCRDRDLVLVEDCTTSMFATLRGRPVGTFGDLALFDLERALPVPSGALLVERHGARVELVEALAAQPRAPCTVDGVTARTIELVLDALELDAAWLGRGLRVVRAGIERAVERLVEERTHTPRVDAAPSPCGLAPLTRHILERIDYDRVAERRRILHALLHQRLEDHVTTIERDGFDGAAPDGLTIVVEDRARAIAELRARGVGAWPALSDAEHTRDGELAALAAHAVSLPLHQDLTLEHVEHVAWAVSDAGAALAPRRGRPRLVRAPTLARFAVGAIR